VTFVSPYILLLSNVRVYNNLCKIVQYQLDLSPNPSLETLPDELWDLLDLFLVPIEGNHLTHLYCFPPLAEG